ncbi:hypothetical protein HY772_06860 [Candidatus Woesearchaeota archaeon]|nr:hypothetical protein [Candidatus Woesearchaeota archaeon]
MDRRDVFVARRNMLLSLLACTFIVFILIAGCATPKQQTQQAATASPEPSKAGSASNAAQHTLKGVSLSPKSFEQQDFIDFFVKAKQAGEIVTWSGDWNELSGEKGGPRVVMELASRYDYTPVIITQFFTQSSGKLLRPLDAETKRKYKESAVAFAKAHKPKYFGFGIEVNILNEKSPNEFDAFVEFYDEVSTAVKEASPNTKIFTVFQLEKMKGMNGGLFGGKNDPTAATWSFIDRFPKTDIAAFTSYPGLVYKNPSDIPTDYYTEITKHTSKPIAFTELGWHAKSIAADWDSSDEKQEKFVNTFFDLTSGINKELVIWSFLYDQKTIAPFDTMGLFSSDSTARPAWAAWRSK